MAAKQKVELQAKKLADAKRKLAELEAQVENIRRAQMHTNDENEQAPNHKFSKSHHQIKNNNLRQQIHLRQEHNLRQYQSNIPFDPNSPLSVALKQTTWPLGYKPTQLPKYNGSVDPTQFLIAYQATIASAGGGWPKSCQHHLSWLRSNYELVFIPFRT